MTIEVVSQYINAQPNHNAQPVGTHNAPWDYDAEPYNEWEKWKTKTRENAELKLTPIKTFWLKVFLSKGKTIETYNEFKSTEQSNIRFM